MYAIPSDVDDRALYYNKDLLVRAGFTDARGEAKPPTNWEELRAYAKALTEYDRQHRLKAAGFIPNYGNGWLYMFCFLNGGELMSADGTRCTMNDPRNIEALTFMKALYDDMGGYEAVQGLRPTSRVARSIRSSREKSP